MFLTGTSYENAPLHAAAALAAQVLPRQRRASLGGSLDGRRVSLDLARADDERASLNRLTQESFKRLPGAPKTLPADFHADDMRGLQQAIEDVNGVTFRDADTEIRSAFGVYQTGDQPFQSAA